MLTELRLAARALGDANKSAADRHKGKRDDKKKQARSDVKCGYLWAGGEMMRRSHLNALLLAEFVCPRV